MRCARDGRAALPRDGRGDGVGGGDRLRPGRLQRRREAVGARVGRGEREIRRQDRSGVAAGEMDRARVAGRDVAVRVVGRDGEEKAVPAVAVAGHSADTSEASRGRRDAGSAGGRGGQAAAGDLERVAGPHLVQRQAGEGGHAIDGARSASRPVCCRRGCWPGRWSRCRYSW